MVGVDRWIRRFHMEKLMRDTYKFDDMLEVEADSEYLKDLSIAKMDDGRVLDFDDPALTVFVQMIDALTIDVVESLKIIIGAIKHSGLLSGQRRLEDNFHLVDKLFELRKDGGWAELDRLIERVSGESMTVRVSRVESWVRYAQDDPGLGGDTCCTLGFKFGGQLYDSVAFGSKPEYVLRFLDDLQQCAGAMNDEGRSSGEAVLMDGKRILCTIPLKAREFSVNTPGNVLNYYDPKTMAFEWSKVAWQAKDPALMALLAEATPAARVAVKSRYLEEELGM